MTARKWSTSLTQMEDALKGLEAATVSGGDLADAAGRVRAVERRLAACRKRWNEDASEEARDVESVHGPDTFPKEEGRYGGSVRPRVTGQQFRTVESRSATRSYNTAAILHGIGEALERGHVLDPVHGGDMDPLMFALRDGVAVVTWKWTPLKNLALALGMPVRTVDHAIVEDGDVEGAWVGEDWKVTYSQEAITEDNDAPPTA